MIFSEIIQKFNVCTSAVLSAPIFILFVKLFIKLMRVLSDKTLIGIVGSIPDFLVKYKDTNSFTKALFCKDKIVCVHTKRKFLLKYMDLFLIDDIDKYPNLKNLNNIQSQDECKKYVELEDL